MWNEFGFTRNLYDTHPVKGDDIGVRLLVGREVELRSVERRIRDMDSIVTVEGPNGVGKTSLVLVAGYALDKANRNKGKDSTLLLPEPFQFSSDETALDLKRRVYASIASFFIDNEHDLRRRLDLQFNLNPLKAWLDNPLFLSGGATVMGSGVQGSSAPNTSTGFDIHGFFNVVDRLLTSAFSSKGGVICVLDNLEILNTSKNARRRLEELRDDLFAKHGIRWVVCGARGIVRSVASSARLQGRLQEPLEIVPLQSEAIEELISSRVQEYANSRGAVPPVGVRSFQHIFSILNQNLRDAFKFSGDFCLWLADRGAFEESADDYHNLFEVWLAEQSQKYSEAVNVPPRAFPLFDEISEQGGVISPSDYQDFGFNKSQGMRASVSKLEYADMVVSETDETDHRRRTIAVTAKGWLIRYHRSGFSSQE